MNAKPKPFTKRPKPIYPIKEWLVKFNLNGKYLQATIKSSTRATATKSVLTKYPEAILQSAKILSETPGFCGISIPHLPKDLKDAFLVYHQKKGVPFREAIIKLMAEFLTRHGVVVTKEMLNPLKDKRYYPDETKTEE